MADNGLSHKTIAKVNGVLSDAMATAARLGYRADNSRVGVEPPRSVATRDGTTVLTPGRVRAATREGPWP